MRARGAESRWSAPAGRACIAHALRCAQTAAGPAWSAAPLPQLPQQPTKWPAKASTHRGAGTDGRTRQPACTIPKQGQQQQAPPPLTVVRMPCSTASTTLLGSTSRAGRVSMPGWQKLHSSRGRARASGVRWAGCTLKQQEGCQRKRRQQSHTATTCVCCYAATD